MKQRTGFVSNSSSSSFIIKRKYVSEDMLEKILDHKEKAGYDAWNITVEDKEIICSTDMNNFDLMEYVINIGVPFDAIKE